MVGLGNIFLHLVKLIGVRYVNRILLAVQCLKLKCIVYLAEVHRRTGSAACLEEFHIKGIVRHSQHKSFDILGRIDRTFGICDLPKRSGPASHRCDSHLRYAVHQPFSRIAVQVIEKLGLIVEHVRYGDHVESRVKAGIDRGGQNNHVK